MKMKLISLNIEGNRHLDTVLPFLEKEQPDCIALMESPADMLQLLGKLGYHTTFSPMTYKHQDDNYFEMGILFASRSQHKATSHYYYRPNTHGVAEYNRNDKRNTIAHSVIFAEMDNVNIATTHFTWNPVGETADLNQTTDLKALLSYLKNHPAHILCGDMNIPRHQNSLYEELTKHYTDNIPLEYKSSLDRNLHRFGGTAELQKLFDSFMVDYAFTQPPYQADNTRLEFGISDHAAVITTINI